MTGAISILALFLLIPGIHLHAESFRTIVEGSINATRGRPAETVSIGIEGSVLVNIDDVRFVRGIELEITAPQTWLPNRGALGVFIFNSLNHKTANGLTDFDGRRIAYEPLPARLRIVYHIPIRQHHGLRTSTSVTVPPVIAPPDTFPILFRLLPIDKGTSASFDQLRFNVTVRPILSDEGAVKLAPRYPPQLRNRPFTVLIDDTVISNISEEIVLREGEHHLVILSDDYRNESRRFLVERGRVIDLFIELQDPTPIILFECPQNTVIFLNSSPVPDFREPVLVDPGSHEVKFQIGDYTIIRSINIQRGKTYRIALEVDLTVHEED